MFKIEKKNLDIWTWIRHYQKQPDKKAKQNILK